MCLYYIRHIPLKRRLLFLKAMFLGLTLVTIIITHLLYAERRKLNTGTKVHCNTAKI